MQNFDNPLATMMLDLTKDISENKAKKISNHLAQTTATRVEILSHTLLRSKKNPNEWYPVPKSTLEKIGEGAFGSIYPLEYKIVCNNSEKPAQICSIHEYGNHKSEFLTQPKLQDSLSKQEQQLLQEDQKRHEEQQQKVQEFYADRSYVVKQQTWTNNDSPDKIERESQRLAEQYVEVRDVIHDEENRQSYIIMENCGRPLDKVLQEITDFNSALKIALGIINAKKMLEDKGIVHRDLKPENICIRNGQVIFIDFGFALDKEDTGNKVVAGTLVYIAPETKEKGTTFASDNYSLAGILYLVFKASNPFLDKDCLPDLSQQQNREENNKRVQAILDAPFNDEGLFAGLDMIGVDEQLQQDIKAFLKLFQDPLRRPHWEWIYKFFASIPERQEALKNYQENKKELSQSVVEFSEKSQALRETKGEEKNNLEDLQERKEVLNIVRSLLSDTNLSSHSSIVTTLVKDNLPLAEYDQHMNTGMRAAIIKMQLLIKKLTEQYNARAENIFTAINSQQGNFAYNRHSGFRALKGIAATKESVASGLVNAQKLGKSKVSKNLANWWRQLHIPRFKMGREKKVHAVYQDLAKISVKDIGEINRLSAIATSEEHSDWEQTKAMLKLSDHLNRMNGVLQDVESSLKKNIPDETAPKLHSKSRRQEIDNEDHSGIVKHTMMVF